LFVLLYQGSRCCFMGIESGTCIMRFRSVNCCGFDADLLEVTSIVSGKTAPPPDVYSLFEDG